MDKLNFQNKNTGDVLQASEWNAVVSKTDEIVDAINNSTTNNSGSSNNNSGSTDTTGVVTVNAKGNTTISATKHINIEPAYVQGGGDGTYGDVQIKPGDDITLESHHRAQSKRDEITVKTSNGQDGSAKAPVKLQVIAADMTLSSKGKVGNDSNVMNVNVTTGSGKGYLKVRAQAIDLRCEEHGGIALQPKGTDSDGNMNKIKFEHGGGDGLEFGTFNAEKTSIFTDEYRFNKDGIWKMATRTKEVSDKVDTEDRTTAYKYVKQDDDFYDIITPYDPATDEGDVQCTTKDIIKTANALNGTVGIHTKVTKKGALEIGTSDQYFISYAGDPEMYGSYITLTPKDDIVSDKWISLNELKDLYTISSEDESRLMALDSNTALGVTISNEYYGITKAPAPSIKIESGNELKLGGILDFGSSFNFGETDNGIEVQYKLTKKNATKDCGVVKVVGVNNHASNTLAVPNVIDATTGISSTVSIPAGQTATITSCSILDIINLVNYMKANQQGPWGTVLTGETGPTAPTDA